MAGSDRYNCTSRRNVVKDNNIPSNTVLVTFHDGSLDLNVTVSSRENTVWLSLDQISQLFEKDKSTVSRHIRNIYSEGELEKEATIAKNATVQIEGSRTVTRHIEYYNLDVIISVGYRVKSKRGIAFRKWATGILNDYMLKGYAENRKRLQSLGKTIELQSRIIAHMAEIEEDELSSVINQYTQALDLLDDYDHQCLRKPKGDNSYVPLEVEKCRYLIDSMKFSLSSDVFGTEKTEGALEGILGAVYQSVFGEDVYHTVEEKAASLLYFLVKDHPFNDGCKRIGAALFLAFLQKNGKLYSASGRQIISNNALVAITLMLAESQPDEKDAMIVLLMNLLSDS